MASLASRGAPAGLCLAVAREAVGNTCKVTFECLSTSEDVDFNRFLRTGGRESTVLWNCEVFDIIEP
eukprot:11164459-Lingulodinium_polyedra.AAC.1